MDSALSAKLSLFKSTLNTHILTFISYYIYQYSEYILYDVFTLKYTKYRKHVTFSENTERFLLKELLSLDSVNGTRLLVVASEIYTKKY